MPRRVLILGGTGEANDLARRLIADGLEVTLSLAGRTARPKTDQAPTRIGGFGGVDGLGEYLQANRIDLLVDATHPFATKISANALAACDSARVDRVVFDRPPWQPTADDHWLDCTDLEEAARRLPAGAVAFLALGHQHLAAFSARDNVRFVARMVDPPSEPPPLADHELIIGPPAANADEEIALFTSHAITHLVARNSGGSAFAKIEAAGSLRLPVLMIARPAAPPGRTFDSVDGLANWIIG